MSLSKKIKDKTISKLEEDTPYLDSKAVICSIGRVKRTDKHNIQIINEGNLVGEVFFKGDKKYVKDVLERNHTSYEIINDDEMIVRNRQGNLPSENYIFCYSVYDTKQFNEILKMNDPDKIIKFLTDYNIEKQTTLYWTFLDAEQRKKLDEISENVRKKYSVI